MSKFEQTVTEDLDLVASILEKLLGRVEELEDSLKFYGQSVNQLEMLVKKISYDLYEEQRPESYVVNMNLTDKEANKIKKWLKGRGI